MKGCAILCGMVILASFFLMALISMIGSSSSSEPPAPTPTLSPMEAALAENQRRREEQIRNPTPRPTRKPTPSVLDLRTFCWEEAYQVTRTLGSERADYAYDCEMIRIGRSRLREFCHNRNEYFPAVFIDFPMEKRWYCEWIA